MLTGDQVQRGVRVRVLADLPDIQLRAGTVGEIVEVRRHVRTDYWGFFLAWWESPSRTRTSLRLTRADLPHPELAGNGEDSHLPEPVYEGRLPL